ncbi:MAG: hypothetical protein QW255_02345 [Candidatus Bilamarchaeaceae archaeon]
MEGNGNLKNGPNGNVKNEQRQQRLSEVLKSAVPILETFERSTATIVNQVKNLKEKTDKLEQKIKENNDEMDSRVGLIEKYISKTNSTKEELNELKRELNSTKKEVAQKISEDEVKKLLNNEIEGLVDDLNDELEENYVKKETIDQRLKEYLTKDEAEDRYVKKEREGDFALSSVVDALDYRTHAQGKLIVEISEEVTQVKEKINEIEKKIDEVQKLVSETARKVAEFETVEKFIAKIKELFPGEEIK